MKIYTKTGDKGETSLFGGQRVPKYHARIEALGTIDELNSILGILIDKTTHPDDRKELKNIQRDLFVVGSSIASPDKTIDLKDRVAFFENSIDKLQERLPELHNFILPGGGELSSLIHHCRAVCRRAERRVTEAIGKTQPDHGALVYLNRLSDLLFVMARHSSEEEDIWKP